VPNYKNDLTGKQFDRLKVIKDTGKRDITRQKIWLCECKCGNPNPVEAPTSGLRDGYNKSCGCLKPEIAAKARLHRTMIDGTCVESYSAKLSKANTSGHKGVYWFERRQKWIAQIAFKGKTYNLGGFADINDAVKVRKEAEKHLFTDFNNWTEVYKKMKSTD